MKSYHKFTWFNLIPSWNFNIRFQSLMELLRQRRMEQSLNAQHSADLSANELMVWKVSLLGEVWFEIFPQVFLSTNSLSNSLGTLSWEQTKLFRNCFRFVLSSPFLLIPSTPPLLLSLLIPCQFIVSLRNFLFYRDFGNQKLSHWFSFLLFCSF